MRNLNYPVKLKFNAITGLIIISLIAIIINLVIIGPKHALAMNTVIALLFVNFYELFKIIDKSKPVYDLYELKQTDGFKYLLREKGSDVNSYSLIDYKEEGIEYQKKSIDEIVERFNFRYNFNFLLIVILVNFFCSIFNVFFIKYIWQGWSPVFFIAFLQK